MTSSNISDSDYYQQPAQTAVTAFLAKLWALVNDSTCDDLIAWDPAGASFHVYDQARFAREILPKYFKHNNFASFIRQLNMYGFRKISTIEHGSLKNERDDIEFAHLSFVRGHETLLELIKRRAPDNQQKVIVQPNKTEVLTPTASPSSAVLTSNTYTDTKPPRSTELSHLLEEVRNLHSKQTSLTDKLFHMQDENQALWREMSLLKQKHGKQQQIVSKLMEFLLHFLTNSTQSHRQSVEQAVSNPSQQAQTQHHTISNQHISNNNLKRKPAAIMLGDEPRKRTTIQQQQQQQQQQLLSQPINLGRQGITINELTDNDSRSWLHTTDASPVVDLVPSPPPVSSTKQHLDDTYLQTTANHDWTVPTDDLRHFSLLQNKSTENGVNDDTSYFTDFFLNTDNHSTNKRDLGQIDEANLTDINTSLSVRLLKEEELDFPITFPSEASKLTPPDSVPFSLDDVTGDVHHIQSSLDNIRELMFDNLPDGTTIEDLFCDDHSLLPPLLTTNGQTTNILTDNTEQSNGNNQFIYPHANETDTSPVQCKQLILRKSVTPPIEVDNQLLEQLMNETAKVEEQRHTINQLERDKIHLKGKIHELEQQKPNPRK